MPHYPARISVVLLFLLNTSLASAGVYADDLGKCLVKSSTASDQVTLVQWMFSALSANPAVTALSTITSEQRTEFNKKVAALYQRLIFTDCREQAVAGLKYEGPTAILLGFQVLGQVAARGLMSDPNARKEIQALSGYTDKEKMTNLYKDAGLQPPPLPQQQTK